MPSEKNCRPTEYRLTLEASEATVFGCVDPAARAAAQATSWPQVETYVEDADSEEWHPHLGGSDIQMIWVGHQIVVRVEMLRFGPDERTTVFYVTEVK